MWSPLVFAHGRLDGWRSSCVATVLHSLSSSKGPAKGGMIPDGLNSQEDRNIDALSAWRTTIVEMNMSQATRNANGCGCGRGFTCKLMKPHTLCQTRIWVPGCRMIILTNKRPSMRRKNYVLDRRRTRRRTKHS